MAEAIKKYAYIDSLRGIAVLGVLLVHNTLYGTNKYPALFHAFVVQGARGVQLFYILSAFTLFLSMSSRENTENHPVLNFFIRRFFRIAPLFYLAIIYYLWQDGFGPRYWLGDAPEISIYNLLSTVTFTNGWNPYWINSIVSGGWSIAIEMTFYLILPFLFKKIKNLKSSLWLTIVMLVISKIIIYVLSKHKLITDERLWNEYLFLFFPSQLPVFLLGIVLFYLIKKKESQNDNPSNRMELSGILLAIAIILIIEITTKMIIPEYFQFGISFVILIYSLYLRPIIFLVNRFTVFLGKISFSMYLTHFAVLNLMKEASVIDFVQTQIINFFIRYMILCSICIFVSAITYNWIEKPGIYLGKKIILMIEKR